MHFGVCGVDFGQFLFIDFAPQALRVGIRARRVILLACGACVEECRHGVEPQKPARQHHDDDNAGRQNAVDRRQLPVAAHSRRGFQKIHRYQLAVLAALGFGLDIQPLRRQSER